MVQASDGSAADVQRVNQQLEDRHYEFRSNCNDGEGDASACHSWGEWLAVVDKNYTAAGDDATSAQQTCAGFVGWIDCFFVCCRVQPKCTRSTVRRMGSQLRALILGG